RAGVGRAAAPARAQLSIAVRSAQPVPDQRRGRPPPVGDGLPAACVFRARWTRGSRGVARAAFGRRRQSADPGGEEGEKAGELLGRNRGAADKPRILGTFNEPVTDWLSFFMFTYFTDRDGRFQLKSLAESAFDPLSRTCRFMLTEEAFHMFVGTGGITRVVKRTLEVMQALGSDDPAAVRNAGAIDLPTLQRYINFWFSSSLDLFGAEISSNAASYFASSLKGRP